MCAPANEVGRSRCVWFLSLRSEACGRLSLLSIIEGFWDGEVFYLSIPNVESRNVAFIPHNLLFAWQLSGLPPVARQSRIGEIPGSNPF